MSSIIGDKISIVNKKENMINQKFPQTLSELVAIVHENSELRNPMTYRLNAFKYDLPPMPHITYCHEDKTQDEIWKLFFPHYNSGNKLKIKSFHPKDFIPQSQMSTISTKSSYVVKKENKVKGIHKEFIYQKDSMGYLTQLSLIHKLRSQNIKKETVYIKFAPIFSDWPNDPSNYYVDWVGWDDFFFGNLDTLKLKLKTNII